MRLLVKYKHSPSGVMVKPMSRLTELSTPRFAGAPQGLSWSGRLAVQASSEPRPASVRLDAPADGVATYQVYVRLPAAEGRDASQPLVFRLADRAGGEEARHESIFRGPGQ